MSGDTVQLYGDGRHPVGIRLTWEGRQLHVKFNPPDYFVTIEPYGRDIPRRLAELLFNLKNSGIRYPGSDPKDVKEQEEKEKAQREAEAEASKLDPERDLALEEEQGGAVTPKVETEEPRKWPTGRMSREDLIVAGIKAGLKAPSLNKIQEKQELVAAVQAATAKQYPEWAAESGYKG